MSDQRFEDRARAAKAARIVRVLERVLDHAHPHATIADLERTDATFREQVGALAKCKRPPSERTWAVAMGLLEERARATP